MSEVLRTSVRLGLAATLLLGSSACGNESEGLRTCSAEDTANWGAPPPAISPDTVAEKLGLEVEDTMRNGIYGPVNCPDGITTSDIETGNSVVSVPDMGGPCVVVGLLEEPESGRSYKDALAICVPGQSA